MRGPRKRDIRRLLIDAVNETLAGDPAYWEEMSDFRNVEDWWNTDLPIGMGADENCSHVAWIGDFKITIYKPRKR